VQCDARVFALEHELLCRVDGARAHVALVRTLSEFRWHSFLLPSLPSSFSLPLKILQRKIKIDFTLTLFFFVFFVSVDSMSSCSIPPLFGENPVPSVVAMSTAVLCHGFNMQALDVEHVLWGNPSLNALGRVPKAALLTLQLNASLLLFGTGASFSVPDRVVEAEFARSMLSADPLRLRAFRGHFDAFSDAQLLALPAKTELELTSLNTVQEIRAAARILVQRRIERLVLVSSNTHAPRCLRDASVVLAELADAAQSADERDAYVRLAQNLLVSPSDVPYLNATPQMVQIVEPPHRPDTLVSFHTHVARFFKVPRDRQAELAEKLDALLRDHFQV
jgi:hypothetical protein